MARLPLNEDKSEEPAEISVNRLIVIGLITRLVTDTAVQIFFPFLPVIAAGWRTSSIAAGRLVSLRSLMGLFSPAFGVMADQRGYRFTMRLGLLLAAFGYLLVGLSTHLWLAAVGMIFAGMGTFSFVPTLQAYLSIRLPFNRRARGLGTLEYSWALSGIVGLYLVGILIDAYGWRVPLFVVSGLMLLAFLWYGRLPSVQPQLPSDPAPTSFSWQTIRNFFELGSNRRSAWAVLLVASVTMFSAMHIVISFGTWLLNEYQLGARQLGLVAFILGVADLCGSVLVSMIGDRVGLRRTVFVGMLLTILGYGLLPLFNQGIAWAVFGLILTRFSFEGTIVGIIALISEQAPAHRGKMMTLAATSVLLGSSVAGFSGPLSYAKWGVAGLGLIPAGVLLFNLPILFYFVRERAEEA